MEADLVAVEGPFPLALRLANTHRTPRPPEVPDRLAALTLHFADAVPAERAEQISVEGKAPLDRGDDDVEVVDAARAHRNSSDSACAGQVLRSAVPHCPAN